MRPADPTGILITRPDAGGEATARRVAAMGFTPVLAPLLTVRMLGLSLPPATSFQAVLATSANAIPSLPASLHATPFLAVGDATADRARQAGFAVVRSAGRDAAALAALVAEACDPRAGSLLLASGRGQGLALAARLRDAGFRVLRRAVYAAVPATSLPDNAVAALRAKSVRAALFFSPATARVFVRLLPASLCPASLSDIDAIAISREAEAALAPLPWRRIRVASEPNQDRLLALLT
jgi:uroporphyrinogen-III synthase